MEKKPISGGLRYLNRATMRYIDANTCLRFTDKGCQDLTGVNVFIILYIDKNRERDTFQKDLEKEFGITRSTASKNIDLMVKKGYIERCSVEYDARLKKLVLTEKSKSVLEVIHSDGAMLEKALTKGFSEEELETLRGFIGRLIENIKITPEEKK